jgi:hypothetical protein
VREGADVRSGGADVGMLLRESGVAARVAVYLLDLAGQVLASDHEEVHSTREPINRKARVEVRAGKPVDFMQR